MVEISIPLVGSKKLDSLTVDVPIPAVNSDLDLGSFNAADGTKAATTLCSAAAADGGVDGPAKGDGPAQGDGPTVGDGPASGDGGTSCTKDADCIALDDGFSSQGKCISGTCRMECLLAYFDVNGLTGDGCEVEDIYFDSSTEAKAYLMADTDDCAASKTLSLPIPSDDLWHVATGGYLTFGAEKWVKVKITDKLCTLAAKATFDVSKLPSSHTYRVDTRYVCKGGVSSALSGKSVTGGSSASLSPTIPCPGLDDTGTLYMRVYQISGGHSTTAVKITVEP